MNRIDVLLKTPFSSLSIEEKFEEKKSLVRINIETLKLPQELHVELFASQKNQRGQFLYK
jgi:hypothetical protein